jgi:hypothetical protein
MRQRKKRARQRCSGHFVGQRCNAADNSEATVLSKMHEGTDVTLRKMSEAAMFRKMGEGGDATLPKNREATVFPETEEGTDV